MTGIASIRARALDIAFKLQFKHASATRAATQTLWVEAHDEAGRIGCGEGCPREYVTGETLEGALAFVAAHATQCTHIGDVAALRAWVEDNRDTINGAPAAWSAIELALLDLFAQRAGRSIEGLLGLPALEGSYRYSAVIGDGPPERFAAELARYVQTGFRDFKIKLSGDVGRDRAKVDSLRAAKVDAARVRADANNLWSDVDSAAAHLCALDYAFVALEEPLRANDLGGMAQLAARLDCAIVLDESALRSAQLRALAAWPVRWIANVRISKMGGLLRALAFADAARSAGMRIVIGAHVGETSLLTRAALALANVSRDILFAQEGAFGTHLLTRDVIDPPIMFGAGGVLHAANLGAANGWGCSAVAGDDMRRD